MTARQEFKDKLKFELQVRVPMWVTRLINVESMIDDNVEVIIKWLRKNKQLVNRLLKE